MSEQSSKSSLTPEEIAEFEAIYQEQHAQTTAKADKKPGWLLRIEAEEERKARARAGIRKSPGRRKEMIAVIRPPGTVPLLLNPWYSIDAEHIYNGRGEEVQPVFYRGEAYVRVYVVWDGEKSCYKKRLLRLAFQDAKKALNADNGSEDS